MKFTHTWFLFFLIFPFFFPLFLLFFSLPEHPLFFLPLLHLKHTEVEREREREIKRRVERDGSREEIERDGIGERERVIEREGDRCSIFRG
jgi:hypothetical protein